jgi:PAS domain S-box-containing protein
MITAMSRIRLALIPIATRAFPEEKAQRARMAIARVCDLDLAIMLETYREDLSARIRRIEQMSRASLEAQLADRKRFFDAALNAADVLLLGFHTDGHLAVFNRKAEQVTGYAADDVVGTVPFERLFGTHAAEVRRAFLSDTPREVEAEMVTRVGKLRTVQWHVAKHDAEDARSSAHIVVGVDLTEQRELERRSRQNERLAAVGALAAGLAHEIRNPLNGAGLHLAVLERALRKSPDVAASVREAMDVVRAEISRLSSLVTDFLQVARPRPLAPSLVDINDLARAVVTLVGPEAAAKSVTLRAELWPFPITANVDEERCKQVLLNLARNALEAVSPGGSAVVRVRQTAHHLELEVEDDGPGVSDPSAPIFDAFYTTKESGTGLGLSIVHRIVTDHGGDVSFQTRPGCTVFTVRLPVSLARA